jgi:hypothetical protein
LRSPALIRKHNGLQINIDDAVEIGIARPAADNHAPFDAAVPYADRYLTIGARPQEHREPRHLQDYVAQALLDEADRRILAVGHEIVHQ